MLGPLDRLGSPRHFYVFAERSVPWLGGAVALLLAWGLAESLWLAPPDYQQGETYRILFVHVPAAWMSMFVYVAMAVAAGVGLVWRVKMAHVFCVASAPVGAGFTLVTLVTGSIWGKPMWGSWWVWDARLTSELVLLFLYVGFIAFQQAVPDRAVAWRAGAALLLVGVVNIPIIHYSVEWWSTLHQPASIMRLGPPAIDPQMLPPLGLMALAFALLYALATMIRAQAEILRREARASWVRAMLEAR